MAGARVPVGPRQMNPSTAVRGPNPLVPMKAQAPLYDPSHRFSQRGSSARRPASNQRGADIKPGRKSLASGGGAIVGGNGVTEKKAQQRSIGPSLGIGGKAINK